MCQMMRMRLLTASAIRIGEMSQEERRRGLSNQTRETQKTTEDIPGPLDSSNGRHSIEIMLYVVRMPDCQDGSLGIGWMGEND